MLANDPHSGLGGDPLHGFAPAAPAAFVECRERDAPMPYPVDEVDGVLPTPRTHVQVTVWVAVVAYAIPNPKLPHGFSTQDNHSQ